MKLGMYYNDLIYATYNTMPEVLGILGQTTHAYMKNIHCK